MLLLCLGLAPRCSRLASDLKVSLVYRVYRICLPLGRDLFRPKRLDSCSPPPIITYHSLSQDIRVGGLPGKVRRGSVHPWGPPADVSLHHHIVTVLMWVAGLPCLPACHVVQGRGQEASAEADSDTESGQDTVRGASYDYLMTMPISNLTAERIAALQAEADVLAAKVADLHATHAKAMWREDLDAFMQVRVAGGEGEWGPAVGSSFLRGFVSQAARAGCPHGGCDRGGLIKLYTKSKYTNKQMEWNGME